MFTIIKSFRFEAAHELPNHAGKCHRLHGHSWVGKLVLQSPELHTTGSQRGMVQDFGDVSKVLKPFVEEKLDHQFLNVTTPLQDPTSEALARWIYEQLKPALPLLKAVQIEETCTSSCCYEPETLESIARKLSI